MDLGEPRRGVEDRDGVAFLKAMIFTRLHVSDRNPCSKHGGGRGTQSPHVRQDLLLRSGGFAGWSRV